MNTYRNIETGFEFRSSCECNGKGWVKVSPGSFAEKPIQVEEKPKKTPKRTTKK